MPFFSFPDVAEWTNFAEVSDHLIVSCPGTVLIIERFMKRFDFGLAQVSYRSMPLLETDGGLLNE